ncbi:MAG: FKBP-type peptidyl-prolyl cis-trans isomerase, partial [Gammaproteobacteria bacterium]|nr:FKBP-type peptidyl-prolyl cis-trans isomerase [Gammaproteobacteria bacterium]
MRDILISSAVCVGCLLLALVSQIVAPSTVNAAPSQPAVQQAVASAPVQASFSGQIELDPEDPNPSLFTMASDVIADSGASALGGEMVAAKERMTPSGLRITDLVIGD